MRQLKVLLVVILAGLLALTNGALMAYAASPQQTGDSAELEPNNSCAAAQDLGALGGPLRLQGSIAPIGPEPAPDTDGIDFFRLTAAPGMRLALELRGAPSGQGTLGDPLIGVFNAACNQIAALDDSLGTLEPVLILTVPDDGVLVIAATAFADFNFIGAGYSGGSYTLRVDEARLIAGITGRLIDNTTGAAPGGWLQLMLQRCEGENCTTLRYGEVSEGAFNFPSSEGEPLFAGSYRLVVRSERYAPLTTWPFEVARDELKTLEPVTLTRLAEISSISGRLINALTGAPLGPGSPTSITLNRCVDGDCQYYLASLSPDPAGYFRFDAAGLGQPLMIGEYLIVGYADQFVSSTVGPFTVGEGEDYQLGDLAIQPNPIQFFEPQGCPPIPAEGGTCAYSIRLVNNQPEPVELQVWSIIQISGANNGSFQPEPAQALSLDSGASQVLNFSVQVPPGLPSATSICGTIFVADAGEGYYFRPRANSFVFCSEVASQP